MEKKTLLILTFVTLGAIAFLSGYLLTSGGDTDSQTGSLIQRFSTKIVTEQFEVSSSRTLPLSGRRFVSFVVPDSESVVAVDKNGDIVEIDTKNLRERVVTTLGQKDILEAQLSPTGESVVYSYYDGAVGKKQVYFNFKKGESVNVSGDLRSAAFSPYGDRVSYLVSTEGGGELLIYRGITMAKRLLRTRLGAAIVSWPSDFLSVISYSKDGYGDLFVLKEGGTLNKIMSYKYDLTVRWSPSGEKFLFSEKDRAGTDRLFYQGTINDGTAGYLDAATSASKCVWANEGEVICGIKNQIQLKDEFYKIDLANGAKTLISTPSTNLLIKELALSRSGDTIFVLNDIDGKIYAVKF